MTHGNTDRNLLIGILALQMDFITRDQLVEAMGAWVLDKSQTLDDVLLRQEAIDENTRDLILALVEKHLEMHQGDAGQSLAAVSSVGSSVREQLQSMGDADVEVSLAHVPDSGDVAEGSPFTLTTIDVGESSSQGLRFRVLRPHAKGGLGQVSVALDQELHREVALKEIQTQHADNPDRRTRFLMEAEITGGLEHPGIVPVYGLGTYSDGRPFYAMRFIRGDSLKEAIDRFHQQDAASKQAFSSLEFRKLLGRFVDVCNAIEYAHSRGVLHRDLKPGNIMLGKYGETLVVDWGLSKVVGRKDVETKTDEATLQVSSGSGSAPTQMGAALGTPAYMSPEQAAGRLDQLGPASDVYSLGATLYCLLVGKPPFEQRDLGEVLYAVRDGDFQPPRATNSAIPKSLKAVCLKSMALKGNERYTSPVGLADEIESWMADEPVRAYPEPFSARLSRWVRRHQAQVASAAAVVLIGLVSLAVVSGVIATSNRKLSMANQELDDANTQLADANTESEQRNVELQAANARITAAETKVRKERDIAVAINDFVRQDLLGQASPDEEPHRDVKLRTVLDRAADAIGDRFAAQPLVEAAIQLTVGNTYKDLGEYGRGMSHLERSYALRQELLGSEDPQTLVSQNCLGEMYLSAGQLKKAQTLLEEAVDVGCRVLGEEHPDTLGIKTNLGSLYNALGRREEAEALFKKSLESQRRLLGTECKETLATMGSLASLYYSTGRYDDAETLQTQVLETRRRLLGEEHPHTLTGLNSLATVYSGQGRFDQAESLYKQAWVVQRRVLGEWHSGTIATMHNLARLYMKRRRFAEAEPLFVRALETRQRTLGHDHPATLSAMQETALFYEAVGRLDEAMALGERALEARKRVLGEQHPSTVAGMHKLASVYHARRDFEKARSLQQQALNAMHDVFGREHPSTLAAMSNLASIHAAQGELEQAESLYMESLAITLDAMGRDHPSALSAMHHLAILYERQRRYAEAERLYVQLLDDYPRVLGEQDAHTLQAMSGLAGLYQAQKRYEESEALFEETLTRMSRVFGEEHVDTLNTMDSLGHVYWERKKYELSVPLFEKTTRIRIRKLGKDHGSTQRSMANLAANYQDAGQHDKAIPLLRDCCENGDLISAPFRRHLRQRLVLAYHFTDRFDLAESLLIEDVRISREANGTEHWQTAKALNQLGQNMLMQEKYTEAESTFRECLEIQKKLGIENRRTLNTRSLLSIALIGKKDYAQAEPIALQGYEEILEELRRNSDEFGIEQLQLAVSQIVKLYKAWNKPDEAAKWQAKLTELEKESDKEATPGESPDTTGQPLTEEKKGTEDGKPGE